MDKSVVVPPVSPFLDLPIETSEPALEDLDDTDSKFVKVWPIASSS